MNNFWQRALTGLVFVVIVVASTLHEYAFLGLLSFICIVAMIEYYTIIFKGQWRWSFLLFIAFGLSIIFLGKWYGDWFPYTLPMLFSLTAIYVLLSGKRDWRDIGYLISGLLYIALPLFFFYVSVFKSDGYAESPQIIFKSNLALNLFVLIWCSDTFAYLCGRAFGKRKLFEAVSPKKTLEGFIGGAILTLIASYFLARYLGIPAKVNLLVALCTVVFGTLGDLVESMLKREFDVKDSGNILPGHGGVLDRFDALLISLPFTTMCYYIFL